MNSWYEDVCKFQAEVLMEPKPQVSGFVKSTRFFEGVNCLKEEIDELEEAYLKQDLASTADALIDLIYFALGMACRMGLPMDEAWKLVHEANMKKIFGVTKRGFATDAVKPFDWADPVHRIRELLK